MEDQREIKEKQNLPLSIMGKPGFGKVTTTRKWLQEQFHGKVIYDPRELKGGH